MLPYFELFSLLIVCFSNSLSLGSKHLLEKATCLSHSKVIPQHLFLRVGMHEVKIKLQDWIFQGNIPAIIEKKRTFPIEHCHHVDD